VVPEIEIKIVGMYVWDIFYDGLAVAELPFLSLCELLVYASVSESLGVAASHDVGYVGYQMALSSLRRLDMDT